MEEEKRMSVKIINPYVVHVRKKSEKKEYKKIIEKTASELATKNNVSYNGDAINKINEVYRRVVRK